MLIQFNATGYKTKDFVINKMDRLLEAIDNDIRYVVAVQNGRHYPVAFLLPNQMWAMRQLIDHGVYIVG